MMRMIDANINRICEGLRVLEDYLRFEKNESLISKELKGIRHWIRESIGNKIASARLNERDSQNDNGKPYSKIEENRQSIKDLIKANLYRVEEGLRVLEETFKLDDNLRNDIPQIKNYRFQMYELEKKILQDID